MDAFKKLDYVIVTTFDQLNVIDMMAMPTKTFNIISRYRFLII